LLFIDFIRYHETEALLQGGDEAWAREDVQRFGASLSTNRRHRRYRALGTASIFLALRLLYRMLNSFESLTLPVNDLVGSSSM
jgi:hypothetical protein